MGNCLACFRVVRGPRADTQQQAADVGIDLDGLELTVGERHDEGRHAAQMVSNPPGARRTDLDATRIASTQPGQSPLRSPERELLSKARLGKLKEFKSLMAEDPWMLSKAQNEHGNALHIAAKNGHKKIVKEILHNADKIDLYARDSKGRNALALATEFKYEELAGYIRDRLPVMRREEADFALACSLSAQASEATDARLGPGPDSLRAPHSVKQGEGATGAECVFCLSRRPVMALLPCGHVCVCEQCAPLVGDKACPLCRAAVERVARIYLPSC